MYSFEYVSKNEWKPVRENLIEIIHCVQDEVREHFTFRYDFVGSSKRNMITHDEKGNKGFDFDVNIEVNDPDENYSAEEIRKIIKNALDKVLRSRSVNIFNYDNVENSTRVLTIKVKDRANSRIVHSCDFCIVNECSNGRQQYIRFNKKQNSFSWEYQPKGYYELPDKISWIKSNDLWEELKCYYLYKKNINTDPNKHSRTIFAEAVHEIWQKNN